MVAKARKQTSRRSKRCHMSCFLQHWRMRKWNRKLRKTHRCNQMNRNWAAESNLQWFRRPSESSQALGFRKIKSCQPARLKQGKFSHKLARSRKVSPWLFRKPLKPLSNATLSKSLTQRKSQARPHRREIYCRPISRPIKNPRTGRRFLHLWPYKMLPKQSRRKRLKIHRSRNSLERRRNLNKKIHYQRLQKSYRLLTSRPRFRNEGNSPLLHRALIRKSQSLWWRKNFSPLLKLKSTSPLSGRGHPSKLEWTSRRDRESLNSLRS